MNALIPISYEDSLKARYADARARLFGAARKPSLLRRTIAIETPQAGQQAEAVTAIVIEDGNQEPEKVKRAPVLNMLSPPSSRFLIELASARHGIPVRVMLSRDRTYPIMAARADAMALVFQHTQSSYPMVGKMFGRDHTTVLSAVKKLGRNVKLVELRPSIKAASRPKTKAFYEYAREAREKRAILAREAIRQGYAQGRSVSAIAKDLGYTFRSVKVIASGMGLKHPSNEPRVPPEQADEYKFLTQTKHIPAAEAARMLGQ